MSLITHQFRTQEICAFPDFGKGCLSLVVSKYILDRAFLPTACEGCGCKADRLA